jgi:hypothetical protein
MQFLHSLIHRLTPAPLACTIPAAMPVISLISILDILVLVSSLAAFLPIRDHQRRQGLPYPLVRDRLWYDLFCSKGPLVPKG